MKFLVNDRKRRFNRMKSAKVQQSLQSEQHAQRKKSSADQKHNRWLYERSDRLFLIMVNYFFA
jgi:hypothetical protein